HFKNGYYAIYLRGTSTANLETGNIIKNNFIDGFYYYGIYVYYQDSVQIEGNTLIDGANANYGYAMYLYYCDNEMRVIDNTLNLNPTNNKSGIRAYYCDGTSSQRGLIANNMISITDGTGANYGLYINYSTFTDVYYNSVNITSGSATSSAAYLSISDPAADVHFANNILRDSLGYTLYVANDLGISEIDYNSHYSASANMAYYSGDVSDLDALRIAAPGKATHSVFGDQHFVSNTDLHMYSPQLAGLASVTPLVTEDIDGKVRSTFAPTIGVHEVDLLPIDMAINEILQVPSNTQEFATYPLSAVIKNNGTDTIFGYQVDYLISGGSNVVNTFLSDTLATGQIDTVALTPFTSPAGSLTICVTGVVVGDNNTNNDVQCQNFFGTPVRDAFLTKVEEIEGGCSLTTDTVVVWLKNIGIDTINAPGATGLISLNYVPDFGGTVITESFTSVLNPGDSISYEFTSLIDFANTSQYDSLFTITAWVDYTGDNVNYNDTASTDVMSMHTPYLPVVVSPVSTPYGTQTTLNATSVDLLQWFKTDTSSTLLGEGSNYLTPYLYASDSFRVRAIGGGAGGDVIVGTGMEVNTSLPLEMYYGYTYSQSIYTPADLTDISGSITSISYYYNGNSSFAGDVIDIYMGTTPQNEFLTTNDWVNYSDLTLVYSGTLNTTTTAGWITFDLDVPYTYSANGNLVVGFDENTAGYHSSGDEFFGTQMSNNRSIFFYNDVTNPDPINPPTTGYTLNVRDYIPNTKFEIIPSGCSSARVPVYVTVGSQSTDDIGITRFVDPVDGFYKTSTEDVSVKVVNYGINSQSNIPVSFILDGGTAVSEVVPGPIVSGDSVTYTFTQTVDLSTIDTFNIVAYTNLIGDATALNDTTITDIGNSFPEYCISKANYTSYAEMTGIS
ncbi:MAG: hypothetical protein KAH32_03150, partial [Chlamydiia bacterium]|nr:hypothetical protein [Chlamydiia bacterium]